MPGRFTRFFVINIILSSLFVFAMGLEAQEVPNVSLPVEVTPEQEQEKKPERNVNIDSRLAYGMYNTILASFNLAQDHELFTYQLNSDLRRSNDFGFKNSSYYEGDVGFTG